MDFLYNMTVNMTVTVIVLLVFKAVFKNKLSARQQLYIWLILVARMIFPQLPQSELSVYNVVNVPVYEQQNYEIVQMEAADEKVTEYTVERHEEKKIELGSVLCGIWLAGFITLFIFFSACYVRFLVGLGKAAPAKDFLTEECRLLVGVKKHVTFCCGGESPMLAGIMRPKIIIPEGYSDDERRDIIIHELCHLKNNDIIILWFGLMLTLVNWFNPVIWYAFSVLRRDVEVYCDERALKYSMSKKSYAELLLKTTIQKNRFIAGTTAVSGGERDITRRIKHIAYFKKPGVLWSVIVAVCMCTISAACLTNSYSDCTMDADVFSQYVSNIVGSEMADIEYADNDKVILRYGHGLYCYSIGSRRIEKAYDLAILKEGMEKEVPVDFAVTVSSDGREAFVVTYEMNNDGEDLIDNFIIKLENGKAKATQKSQHQKPFKNSANFTETSETLPDIKGWTSYSCINNDGKYYCLALENGFEIRDIKLIVTDEEKNVEDEYFPFSPGRVFVEGKDFGFYAPGSEIIKGDYPETVPEGKIGLAENVIITDFRNLKGINNHSENTTVKSIYGHRKKIYKVTEEYTAPVAAGEEKKESLTMLFVGYPTKTDEYAVIYFNTGTVSENDVNYMLSSFRFYMTPLYEETEALLMEEFFRVYSPIYEILDLRISGWEEDGNKATFHYNMTEKNYDKDPDTVEYIKKAKEEGSKHYETYKREYLMPRESNYHFMVIKSDGKLEIKENIGHKGEEWVTVRIDDYIMH